MSNITNNKIKSELVFVPMPGMGHLLAAMELSKLILSRHQCISITIYIINAHIPKLTSYVNSQSLDNQYPTRLTLSTLPTLDPLDPLTSCFFTTLFNLHKPLIKEAVSGRVKSGTPKPVGFILDMFSTSMIDIANELDIPCYFFYTSGANFLNLIFYSQSLADLHGVDVPTRFSDPGVVVTVPGYENPISNRIIPAMLQDKESCPVQINHARRYREKIVKGILVNTFTELESFALEALMGKVEENGLRIPPVYPVGPILELNGSSHVGDSQDHGEIIHWLNDQPNSSVVFLCFGSKSWFEADQVREIANALDGSRYQFIWSLRKPPPCGKMRGPPSDDNEIFLEALPESFLKQTAHKGKIVGWVSQVSILSHPAIGGFMSHCGWNSILESLWFGVPIGVWPIYAEQQYNAFELVNELGLAIEITMDYKQNWKSGKVDNIIKAEVIEIGINKLMRMDEEMKGRVKELKDKSREALQNGGSSYNWLDCFIQDVIGNVAQVM